MSDNAITAIITVSAVFLLSFPAWVPDSKDRQICAEALGKGVNLESCAKVRL